MLDNCAVGPQPEVPPLLQGHLCEKSAFQHQRGRSELLAVAASMAASAGLLATLAACSQLSESTSFVQMYEIFGKYGAIRQIRQ